MTGFLKNLFWKNKYFLGGLIEPEKFDENVEKATKEISLVYSYTRKKNVEGISNITYGSLILCGLLLIAYVVLLYTGIKED